MVRQKELINAFFDQVEEQALERALATIISCQGNILFTGVGKSGLAAELLATMFTSIGTKAFYLSPLNALHGDLGMISSPDLVVMLSKSGNTDELFQLGTLLNERGITMMGWFCQQGGKLEKICKTVIFLPLQNELCPYDLSPTTSTILQLTFGNTLAVALMEKKNFTLEKYKENHPSGTIGKKMTLKVQDVMLKENDIPVCFAKQTVQEILVELSDKRCGCILVLDEQNNLEGIFTDGDLRRAIKQDQEKAFSNSIGCYMTKKYLFTDPETQLVQALHLMQEKSQKKVAALPVIKEDKLVGLVRLHDIVALGLN
jgi:arabinose-5-phosphate isomerase